MPVYDYRCGSCAHIFDLRQPMSNAADLVECEECGGYATRIWLSAPGMLMRDPGYNLRPDEPGYAKLPKRDREIARHQFSYHGKQKQER